MAAVNIPEHELRWSFGPSGGPGGQHANTSNTRAELVFEIEESQALTPRQRRILIERFGPRLRVVADDERSQTRNRDLARRRLAEKIEDALKPRVPRRPTTPSRGAKERRLRDKRQQSQRKAGRRRPTED